MIKIVKLLRAFVSLAVFPDPIFEPRKVIYQHIPSDLNELLHTYFLFFIKMIVKKERKIEKNVKI